MTGIAAGLGGAIAGGSIFTWYRRPIRQAEIEGIVLESLSERSWARVWNDAPWPSRTAFPSKFFRSNGWQTRSTAIDQRAVAYDVSEQGCIAVLFAMKTWRDISTFESQPPKVASVQSGRLWESLAIWQQNRRILYALALQGSQRDYARFRSRSEAVPLT